MTASPVHLAVDLGASSGRLLAISFRENSLVLDTIHRFDNQPMDIGGSLYWNHLSLWREIQSGMRAAFNKLGQSIRSIGVDTWGVDYLLLDNQRMPLGPGYCYRDPRNAGMMEKAFARLSKEEIFAESGIQFMQINSLYQLLAQRLLQPKVLDCARMFLMVPDFLHWLLSGELVNEATNASTTQILKPVSQTWSSRICSAMQFEENWFLEPTQPATVLGKLTKQVCDFNNIPAVDVICPATHDTASAVIAIPVAEFKSSKPKWGYISSGTWSLMGVELDKPILTADALQLNFTNEAGPNGSVRLLKNIAGLWPLQQYREQQVRAGSEVPWNQMIAEAANAPALQRLINLDDSSLISPTDMTNAVIGLLKQTGQSAPSSTAEMTRLLLDSLAMRYRVCLAKLERLLGYSLETLYIVGGGVQNELLCQMTADATNRRVIAAHSEATAIGNGLVQAIGTNQFGSIVQARDWLMRALQPKEFIPQNSGAWDDAYARFNVN